MKKLLPVLVITFFSALLSIGINASSWLDQLVLTSYDYQFRLFSEPGKLDKRIIILEVDQDSIDRFEADNIPFPWPRSIYEPLLKYSTDGGAEAVIIDVLFNNITPYGAEVDNVFAAAIKSSGIVHLATAFNQNKLNGKKLPERFSSKVTEKSPRLNVRTGVSPPLDVIMNSAKGLGEVSANPDTDGIYRRIRPVAVYQNRVYPSLFASPLFEQASDISWSDGAIMFGDIRIPVNSHGDMMLNFHGHSGSYRRYSVADVIASAIREEQGLTPTIDKNVFKGAYVLVGYTAPGLFDLKATPLSSVAPGVEVLAVALDNLLNQDFIRVAPLWMTFLFITIACFMTTAIMIYPATVRVSILGLIAQFGIYIAVVSIMFSNGHLIGVPALILGIVAVMLLSGLHRYQTEGKKRRYIQKAFAQYLSPKVVNQLLENPDQLVLGGEVRELTVFFSDLAGFTALSERLQPYDLVTILNSYTSMMSEVILDADGTLDKYIGDAVMAFWGAPNDEPQQVEKAIDAALESLKRLKSLGGDEEAYRKLSMRIGINTGECIVGNIGSNYRFDYTAVGDTVNQAARFEGLGKVYGIPMLVSEATWAKAEAKYLGRKIDFIKVKGKNRPVTVYQVFCRINEATPEQITLKHDYEAAFDAYIARKWDDAKRILKRLIESTGDRPASVLLSRVEAYQLNQPPEDWDGSFVHLTK